MVIIFMCYYITVVFTQKEAVSIKKLPTGVHAEKTDNPAILQQLPTDYLSYDITTNGCSCDLFHPVQPNEENTKKESLVKKYKRKGWSDKKIERAIESHKKDVGNAHGFRSDLLGWFNLITHDFSGSMFVFIHFYSGSINTEKLVIKTLKIKADQLALLHPFFPEDTLVEIKK